MPAELTLCLFFFFFLSLFPFFLLSFISFLFPCFLFCDPSQTVVTVVLASLFVHNKGPLLQRLPWPDFTILTLNHLCLVLVYLPTTTGPSVCHSPSPDKEDYFVCQFTVAPFLATVWVPSFFLSLMACTQWLQLSFFRLGDVSSQQDTSLKRALAGTSKQVFPSPHHQTMSPYLLTHDLTASCIGQVQAGKAQALYVPFFHMCPKSVCCSFVCRDLEACLHSLPSVFFDFLCELLFDFPLLLEAGPYLIMDLIFLWPIS